MSWAARRVVSPVLVGRVEEFGLLVSAVGASPAVVSIEGEAGVGKTRLVSELLGRPEVADRRLLGGRCHPIRESFPLGPVIEALGGVEEALRGRRLTAVAGAVRPLLPELAPLLPPAPEPLNDRAGERHRVFRGLVELLVALSPAVLVLEDLHWADEQTRDFLAYLLADPPPELSVVLTYRGEEVSAGVRALTAKLPAAITRSHLVLMPLDQRETGVLAAAILDADGMSEEFARYLWERTSGLPLAVEEVLALARERGLLVRTGGRWSRRTLDLLEVPRGIRDSTLERVSRLPAAAQRVAEAAAVLQIPVTPHVLLATAGDAGGIEALEEAIGAGLLAERGELCGFRHALAAQAVYENLSGPRQRRLHGEAADALQVLSPAPLGHVAHHLKQAGRLAEWAVAAEAAAGQAVRLADDAEAARLLGEVLRHAPLAVEQRGRIAVRFGWAAIESMQAPDAAETLAKVVDLDLPRPLRGEARFLLALLLNREGGDLRTERRLFTEAIDDLDGRPDLRAWAMVALGIPTTPDVPLSEHLRWIDRSLELAAHLEDPLREVFILGKAGMVLVAIGDPAWRGLADRVLEITGGSPRQRAEANACYSIGVEACYAGHLRTAETLLTAGLATPDVQRTPTLHVLLRSALALLAYCQGRWDGLREDVPALLDELAEYARLSIDVNVVAGSLALARGEVDAARQTLADAIEWAERIGNPQVLPLAVDAAVRAALFRDDVAGAVALVRRCVALLNTKGFWAPVGRLLPAATEALVAAGQQAEARELVQDAEREMRDRDVPLLPAALSYAHGVLDGRAGDFLAAASEFEAVSAPYEAARARERAAALLLASGDERAPAVLRDVVAAYERLGATWDLTRATGLARRHDITLPARHRAGRRGYGAALSPRQRDVAKLAAGGRTNKEIAQELFLSPKTVEKHLGAVMQKLNARTRKELAHLLGQTTSADILGPQ